MSNMDWLSNLLQMIAITGQVEARCVYGAPWRLAWAQSAAYEIPYHVVLKGRGIIEDPETGTESEFKAGDIVLLPHGSAHALHDGGEHVSGRTPKRHLPDELILREHDEDREELDILCGRFFIGPPHDRLIRDYLPKTLMVRTIGDHADAGIGSASTHLASLVSMMRLESAGERPGGLAILNGLTLALFTLALRAATESDPAPAGLLALAAHTRLAPAISAMFAHPARPWSLPDLADLCSMSRATFVRHFQQSLGRSAIDLLTDIRMSVAANELKKPGMSTELVADAVGYQSVAAFRRVFTDKVGIGPGRWRRLARGGH